MSWAYLQMLVSLRLQSSAKILLTCFLSWALHLFLPSIKLRVASFLIKPSLDTRFPSLNLA